MRKQKFLVGLLVLVMVLSLLPVAAFAADDATSSSDNDALHLSKTTTLQNDGTYTIELEAYATGTVTTSTESIPCDIVLLLDQSGSMSDVLGTQTSGNFVEASIWLLLFSVNVDKVSTANLVQGLMTLYVLNSDGTYSAVNINESSGTYTVTKQETGEVVYTGVDKDMQFYRYQTSSTETSKQEGLMTAAKAFIEATGDKNDAITDADQKHRISIVKFAGTETTDVGNDTYESGSYKYNYTQIVQNLTSDEQTLLDKLDSLSEAGATSADYGMNRAAAALGDLSTDDGRNKIIIMFTDGEPNHGNGFSDSVAAATINKAKELKDDGVTIYTIGVLSGANPALNPTLASTSDVNKYLHAVSSNYPSASATNAFAVTWGETGSYTNGFYKTATTSSELTNIFQEIQNSVGSTTITLDETAVMKDIVTDNFILPESFTAAGNVKVETVNYAGNGAFDETTRATLDSAVVTISGRTVDVKGFDYAENYCVDASGTVATSGKKLCVTITGVELNPDQFADGVVNTNADTSGIYDGEGETAVLVDSFDVPTVKLASKSYVLDYAKPVELAFADWGLSTLLHRAAVPHNFVTGDTTGQIDMTYGKLVGSTYTPQTINWNGYDSFYAFGTPTVADNANPYIWSKVNVIPANNVYYEDDMITTTANTGTVSIVNNGNNSVSNERDETSETGVGAGVHGWETGLADDTGYSDGSATQMTTGATATFTFTGTGVDIYSYTDMTTGIVTANIVRLNENGEVVKTDGKVDYSKYLMVDNLAVSDEYYQIPTLSWSGLDYGTYKVQLVVNSAKAPVLEDGNVKLDEDGNIVYSDTEKRTTYYLDGIRVYNPVQADTTVNDAYGADELNAVFAEVRDLMAENTVADGDTGNVFIDLNGDGTVSNETAYDASEYGTYGPKNEVYLAAGQSITFKVDSANKYFIGLKAPAGTTSAAFSNDAATNSGTDIAHTTDLYYVVTPVEGKITVKNTGNNLLSVTKIKMTGADTTSGIALLSMTQEEASAEIAAFSLRSTVAYTAEAEEEIPEDITPAEPEVPDIDVEIDNPEPDQEPENTPDPSEALKDLVKKLFKKLFGWFGRN